MELTIKLDENNKEAKALIAYLKTLSYVSVKKEKKSPYNPEFVKKILEEQTSFSPMSIEELKNRIEISMKDSENNNLTSQDDLIEEIKTWR